MIVLLRMKHLVRKSGLSEAELFRRRKNDPSFPKPVHPGPGITAYIESEFDAYLQRYVAQRDRALLEQDDLKVSPNKGGSEPARHAGEETPPARPTGGGVKLEGKSDDVARASCRPQSTP